MSLELIPNGDLIFKGPFNVVSNTTLKLSNSGNERLAYKIKTTAPKRYCVKPNSGFLDPRALANIQGTRTRRRLARSTFVFAHCLVMLQPQATGQQDDRTKHKFMVQWATVPSTYSDDVENFVSIPSRVHLVSKRQSSLVETRPHEVQCARREIEMYFCRRATCGCGAQRYLRTARRGRRKCIEASAQARVSLFFSSIFSAVAAHGKSCSLHIVLCVTV